MILSTAVFIGFGSGLLRAKITRRRFQIIPLRLPWLVLVAFFVQAMIFSRSGLPIHLPDAWASLGLILSQALLLMFAWINRRHAALTLMGMGLLLNLIVICLNGGWMPISPDTVRTIYPNAPAESWQVGQRLGTGKDIVIHPEDMRLAFLGDRFVLPAWSGSLVAFSLGDVLLACGAGWLLWSLGGQRGRSKYEPSSVNPLWSGSSQSAEPGSQSPAFGRRHQPAFSAAAAVEPG
jgi:hypothetical protein